MNYFYSIYTNNKSELLAILLDKYTEVCHEAILKFLEKHDKLTITHSSDKDTNLLFICTIISVLSVVNAGLIVLLKRFN